MKVFEGRHERMAGLFVMTAVACVIAFIGGSAIQNQWFARRIKYTTPVNKGDGLREGTPVLVSGVPIGKVGELHIMADNHIDVELLVLPEHAGRVRQGVVAEIRRTLGIGEKRVHLVNSDEGETGTPLPPGSVLPSHEPLDLLDAVESVDISRHTKVLERAIATTEKLLSSLEEEERFERMVAAFDRMGPTLEKVHDILDATEEPLVELLKDPNVRRTMRGAARVLNDPATMAAVRGAAKTLEPDRMSRLMARVDKTLVNLDELLADNGHLQGAVSGADKLLNDKRIDKLLAVAEQLSDADKLERLVNNVAALTSQMAKIGPQIPKLTKEMMLTLREAVIVLKAMQKSWVLDDESEEARRELGRQR